MNVILLGAPGSGKGTQSIILNKKFGFLQLSTGEMIRQNIEEKTDLGLRVQSIVNKGGFVNDDIILSMVSNRILMKDCKSGFILDGFPRTISQAKALDEMLNSNSLRVDNVISLEVDDSILTERLLSRGRSDDNEETIKNRLDVYKNQTLPIKEYYRSSGVLVEIKGDDSIEDVSKNIFSALS